MESVGRMESEYRSVFPESSGSDRSDERKTETRIPPEIYRRYDLYYDNVYDLYTKLGEFLKLDPAYAGFAKTHNTTGGRADGSMLPAASVKNMRNPVHRIVEFYATSILTGTAEEAFELEGARDALKEALHRIWAWSNLAQTKEVLKRYVAKHGFALIKIASPTGAKAVYEQFVKAEHVAKVRMDERGNLTYVRLEIPAEADPSGLPKKTRTEIYAKGKDGESGYIRVYIRPADTASDTIPTEKTLKEMVNRSQATLVRDTKLRAKLAEVGETDSDEKYTGYDFVPFVFAAGKSDGEERPKPVFEHALPIVDQANRRATRLDDMLFRYNRPSRALVGIGNDPSGRPLPPPQVTPQKPQIEGLAGLGQGPMQNEYAFGGSRGTDLQRNREDITLGGDVLVGVPGNSRFEDITPNLDFEAQRQQVLDDIQELHEECPELHYSATKDRAQMSGRALRTLLSSAIDRAGEMKANIETALIKANKMALTVAQVKGLEGFSEREIGTYDGTGENGFDHTFKAREILPVSDDERAETRAKELQNVQQEIAILTGAGVPQDRQREHVLSALGLEKLMEGVAAAPVDSTAAGAGVAEGMPGDLGQAAQALQQRLSGG